MRYILKTKYGSIFIENRVMAPIGQHFECPVIHQRCSAWCPRRWDSVQCDLFSSLTCHAVLHQLCPREGDVMCACVCVQVHASILEPERITSVTWWENFLIAQIKIDWLSPPDSILLMMPLKPFTIWRCISPRVFLVRASSHSSKSKGKWCYYNTMQRREACVVLLQLSVFKKHPFLPILQMRANSPAISPTSNSTAPFGLKPRSGKLKPQRPDTSKHSVVCLWPFKCVSVSSLVYALGEHWVLTSELCGSLGRPDLGALFSVNQSPVKSMLLVVDILPPFQSEQREKVMGHVSGEEIF